MAAKAKGVDPNELMRVARFVSERLTKEGVPHLLIGGLAVAAHGYVRATRDVDFLVSREDLSKLTGRPMTIGVTERVGTVDVDFVTPDEQDTFLDGDLTIGFALADGIPVAVMPLLIFLKLRANRKRDQGDVVELIKRGCVRLADTRRFLVLHGDEDMVAEFDTLVLEAGNEED